MSPGVPTSLESHSVKMLAIMEQWDGKGSCHTDNTNQYLYLMLFKASLDAVVLYLCWRRLHTSFLSMCGLSIVLADVALLWSMTIVWFLGPEQSPVSTCFVLAHTSAAYAALPLPMVCLGLLDYLSEDKCLGKQGPLCKSLRNMALVLLVWVFAVVYSLGSAKNDPMEIEYLGGKTALVCEVQESPLVAYFVFGVFIAVILTLVPFWSRIPQWMREAERLSDLREEPPQYQRSDLMFNSTMDGDIKSGEENFLLENLQHRPSLWLSITLGFVTIWMPYLSISVACLLLGLGVPAYIIVNLLWLECTNSLLVGVAFWVKSNRLGPYSHLPDDVCLWRVYWHLSKGTNQQKLPTAVFNPSQGKRKTLLHV
ncbi:probable G-protein coupled receptor 160 [Myripristis murdjan]|uniref:probable G-protein coupled receptor 160 n=1 Tax=Myripristis murdjan TaxID=586833 RepID=UPI001175C969|nr:probable G-protein coupled receptor 160 [Myripristis murdjan]